MFGVLSPGFPMKCIGDAAHIDFRPPNRMQWDLRRSLVHAQKRPTMHWSGTISRPRQGSAMEQTAMGVQQTAKTLSFAPADTCPLC